MTIDPNNLAATATQTFDEDFNSFDLWNGTTGLDTRLGWAMWPQYDSGFTETGNGEQEWYIQPGYPPTASVNPFSVSNGVLTITAQPTPASIAPYVNNYPYTSGSIDTYHEFSQTYGYFEMRAELPAGQGLWPSFWLLPENNSWPPELDVMEMMGSDPTTLATTVHSTVSGTSKLSATHYDTSAGTSVANMTTGFHTYGVDWEPDTITWYFDGQEVFQAPTPADMRQPMYMIANLAVGGYWPGSPDASTQFPAQMQIDYMRAYEPSGSGTGGSGTAPLVSSIATSGPQIVDGNGDLDAGKTVMFSVNFSEAVTVDTRGGVPRLALDDGGSATYLGGSGTTALTFAYVVSAGQNTSQLAVSSLDLNGATIRSAAGADAAVSGAAYYHPAGTLQIDTTAPSVSISLANDAGSEAPGAITLSDSLAGSGDPNAVVGFTVDGVASAVTATADAAGDWTFTPSGVLDGPHTVIASETDAAGNTGTASLSFTLAANESLFGTVTHDVTSPIGDIYALYQTILGRVPDASGLESFTSALEGGTPASSIALDLLASAEYTAHYGSYAQSSPGIFIDQLYENGLGRHADGQGLASWENALGSGVSRAQVAVDIALSKESQSDLAPIFQSPAGVFVPSQGDAEVAQLYYGLLGRAPDAAGFASWANDLASGDQLTNVAAAFMSSAEYTQRLDAPDDAEFVTALYEGALGRAPDAGGLANWVSALDQGASRTSIAVAISESPEATLHLGPEIAGHKIA